MQLETDGLVIAEQSIGESDRLVTVLTRDEGIVRAFARQAKKSGSTKVSATQLFCYSRFTIYKGREKYIIDDARPAELFFDLRRDIECLALAQYFCELARSLAPQEAPAGDFLRLLLNAFHFLGKGTRPPLLIKAAVEMRMLEFAGYMPDLVACRGCACYEAEPMLFYPREGFLSCPDCSGEYGGSPIPLGPGVLTALRHTIYAVFEKLFSFRLPPAGLKALAAASERYTLCTLDRGFQTLDFFHGLVPV